MYNPRGLSQYKRDDISSMPREKLVVALYERVISDLEASIQAVESQNRLAMTQALNHANRIISELRLALDHDIGGEISRNLDALYNYIFGEVLQQMVDKDPAHARVCIQTLQPLLESWRRIPVGTADTAEKARALGMDPATASGKETEAPPAAGKTTGAPAESTMSGTLSVSA